METLHGQIFALYLFDVAEAINLQAAAADIGGSVRAKFAAKPATPAYVQYQQPPLVFEGAAVDIPTLDGFRVGFKLFDYGVISLRLTREFDGTWSELAGISNDMVENEALERQAEQACRSVALRLQDAMTEPRRPRSPRTTS